MNILLQWTLIAVALPIAASSSIFRGLQQHDEPRWLQDSNGTSSGSSSNTYPMCGDCWCVPEPDQACPSPMPQTNFSSLIPILEAFTWTNPMSLDCDPYIDNSCDTDPSLQEGGACVVDVVPNDSTTCPTDWTYSTRTYAGTYQEALDEGLYVTHASACGTCSSLQDLSAYMKTGPDLQDLSSACGIIGQFSKPLGIACFMNLGFTEGCANIWYYNTVNTRRNCFALCIGYTVSGDGANGPPPTCELAKCINCDEEKSGDIFKLYAGRSRRDSGLLSGIVRNCSAVVPLTQSNPCDGYVDDDNNTPTSSTYYWSEGGSHILAALFGAMLVLVDF